MPLGGVPSRMGVRWASLGCSCVGLLEAVADGAGGGGGGGGGDAAGLVVAIDGLTRERGEGMEAASGDEARGAPRSRRRCGLCCGVGLASGVAGQSVVSVVVGC